MAALPVRIGPLLLVTALGCASKGKSAPDAATPAAVAAPADGDVDARSRELDDYEAQLRALGLKVGQEADADPAMGGEAPEPAGDTAQTTEADRCSRICSLAEAICSIQTSVCDLAGTHPDDPRYAEVCRRASADCELASSACEGCER